MYTKEQDGEIETAEIKIEQVRRRIEKVCRVFADYIKENSYFDVVWSEKHYNPL